MEIEIKECPFCGEKKFIEASRKGWEQEIGTGFLNKTKLHHIICLECGSVVRSYVKNPEKLW